MMAFGQTQADMKMAQLQDLRVGSVSISLAGGPAKVIASSNGRVTRAELALYHTAAVIRFQAFA
jgi:hypothetical protein